MSQLRTFLPRAITLFALVAMTATGCAPVRGEADFDPPRPSADCPSPIDHAPLTPADLESFPGCDLEGFIVKVGESGGAVVPAANEGVSSEALGADGEVLEFLMDNFGTDGVALEVRTPTSTETWGPDSAFERRASFRQ